MNRAVVAGRAGVLLLLFSAVASAQPSPYPPTDMPVSPIFPADNWWNADTSGVAADATQTSNFTTFLAAWAAVPAHGAVANPKVHADWGGEVDPSTPADGSGMVYFWCRVHRRVPVTPDTTIKAIPDGSRRAIHSHRH